MDKGRFRYARPVNTAKVAAKGDGNMGSVAENRSMAAVIVTFVFLSWCCVTEGGGASFRELGGFPWSSFPHSVPVGVSADGSVVVGRDGWSGRHHTDMGAQRRK